MGKEYPNALQNKSLLKQVNRDKFHTVAFETTVCSLWKDTKHVSFLLNAHSSRIIGMVFRKLRRGENVILTCLPYAVNFNKNMGAFHRQDQLVSDYAIDRNSRRWWARRFVHFFDAITLNAYTLFTRKISKLWAWLHRNIPLSPLNMKIYVRSHLQVDWKFLLPQTARPSTRISSHPISCKWPWFRQSCWAGAFQVWKMPPLLHCCKRSLAQRN